MPSRMCFAERRRCAFLRHLPLTRRSDRILDRGSAPRLPKVLANNPLFSGISVKVWFSQEADQRHADFLSQLDGE
jgi:hypothetical protein